MGTVRRWAEEVKRGLRAALPNLRKTVVDKVALAVGAMIERQTPNTAELANVLPLATTGELAAGDPERYLPDVRLFHQEAPTNLGILHEAGHPEPWIIAMDCAPNRAAVRDYGRRWGIEPLFSDYKSRGFDVAATPLRAPDRLNRLLLLMALALHGCVRVGQEDARDHPTPLEKKRKTKPIPTTGPLKSSPAVPSPGSSAGCGCS